MSGSASRFVGFVVAPVVAPGELLGERVRRLVGDSDATGAASIGAIVVAVSAGVCDGASGGEVATAAAACCTAAAGGGGSDLAPRSCTASTAPSAPKSAA